MKRRYNKNNNNAALFTMADVERAYFDESDPYDPTYRRRTKLGKVSIVKKGLRTAKKIVIGDTLAGTATRAIGVGGTIAAIALRKRIPGYGSASGFVREQSARGFEAVKGGAGWAKEQAGRGAGWARKQAGSAYTRATGGIKAPVVRGLEDSAYKKKMSFLSKLAGGR